MRMLIVAVALLMLTASTSLFAKDDSLVGSNNPDQLKLIAQHQRWRQLLNYDSSDQSAITSAKFFLSPAGNSDPHQELLATLTAFAAEVTDRPDEHSQCRFPGRYLWLKKHVNFSELNIKPVTCPKYLIFSEGENAQSISLVFATGYLGNPASYYGHLLLKINSGEQSNATDLENTAINFGANIPENESTVLYIVKGIFGGYNSAFTQQQYFYHSHNYGESQLRDLWEYELDLNDEDLKLLIAHQWELIGADYVYYFFNRNCAYRMGELLELVSGENIVNSWRPWEAPQAIVQRLGKMTYQGKPLVKRVGYHPSRQSRLYQRYGELTAKERKAVGALVKQPKNITVENLTGLEPEQQFKVLDTMIDYYQFVRKDKEGDKDINNEHYRRALSARYFLPPGGSVPRFSSANEPHFGRNPSYLNIGITSHETRGDSLTLWLRPAYYDSLDAGYGHIKNASLAMGELKLGVNEGDLYVREVNIVKIESLRRNFTALPGDRNNSWYLEVGAEQELLGCKDCLAAKARSGYGYSVSSWNDKLLIAGFGGAGFLGQSINSEGLYLSGLITLNLTINNDWSLHVSAEQRHLTDNEPIDIYRANARLGLSEQMDMRMHFAQDDEQELGLSLGFYW